MSMTALTQQLNTTPTNNNMSYSDLHLKFADRDEMLGVLAITSKQRNEKYNPDDPDSKEVIDVHRFKYRNIVQLGEIDGQGNGWFVNIRLIDGQESAELVDPYRITVATPCCKWL